jgi:hypothetical protein
VNDDFLYGFHQILQDHTRSEVRSCKILSSYCFTWDFIFIKKKNIRSLTIENIKTENVLINLLTINGKATNKIGKKHERGEDAAKRNQTN